MRFNGRKIIASIRKVNVTPFFEGPLSVKNQLPESFARLASSLSRLPVDVLFAFAPKQAEVSIQ